MLTLSLSRDAPLMRSASDGGQELTLVLRRVEGHRSFLDFLLSAFEYVVFVQIDEPLLGHAEDERVVASPTMRTRVFYFTGLEHQVALGDQMLKHPRVCFSH